MSSQSTVVQWFQNLADNLQHSKFLDYQLNTSLLGLPVATFGLVTIAAAIFVHATFSDEIHAMGIQAYDAAEKGMQKATEMAESTQVVISEQTNRLAEAASAPPETRDGGGGRRRRRRTSRKMT